MCSDSASNLNEFVKVKVLDSLEEETFDEIDIALVSLDHQTINSKEIVRDIPNLQSTELLCNLNKYILPVEVRARMC